MNIGTKVGSGTVELEVLGSVLTLAFLLYFLAANAKYLKRI